MQEYVPVYHCERADDKSEGAFHGTLYFRFVAILVEKDHGDNKGHDDNPADGYSYDEFGL
jgi:hypothetical protein